MVDVPSVLEESCCPGLLIQADLAGDGLTVLSCSTATEKNQNHQDPRCSFHKDLLRIQAFKQRVFLSSTRVELLDRYAWSVPTIVGQTMCLRDQGQITAVDLG